MGILTAQEAFDITEHNEYLELTPERAKLLEAIKEAAQFKYQLKFSFVMNSDDINFFEKLGYDVANASYDDKDQDSSEYTDIARKAGIISWKHPD